VQPRVDVGLCLAKAQFLQKSLEEHMHKQFWLRVVTALVVLFILNDVRANSIRSIDNPANQYERAILTNFPTGFGAAEFTFEIWVKLDNRAGYPVGVCGAGGNPRLNWCSENVTRYSSNCWWCNGNFLIDGINFDGVSKASFALQMYDGGRVRWLIGDQGAAPALDDFWSVGNRPGATNNPRLLDGNWHSIATVRRFTGTSGADYELWIDGVLIDTVRTNVRTNLATIWESYADGAAQGNRYSGWFFMTEKQAVNINGFVLEDFKGQLDEIRFWNRAKSATELSSQWRNPVSVGATGLSGYYDFSDANNSSTQSCDRVNITRCMALANPNTANLSFVSTQSALLSAAPACDPLADTDGDGVSDCVELQNGTNPNVRDNNIFLASSDSVARFVEQQYKDFYDRGSEAGGLAFWQSEVLAGRHTRASVIENFVSSPEMEQIPAPMARLYFGTFLRIPDYGGLTFWTQERRSGRRGLVRIGNEFVASPEFVARYGQVANRQFVELLYRNIFQRAPDAPGWDFWAGRLDRGGERGEMLTQFTESSEYRFRRRGETLSTLLYAGMLRRAPTQAEFDTMVAAIASGATAQSQILLLLNSAEYRSRFVQ
jgi:Domain of unknown function (DUF4214)/Bacterial TSP3 repeat